MPGADVELQVGLDVDNSDVDAAVHQYMQDIQANLSNQLDLGDAAKAPAEMVEAMRELKSLAQDIKNDFRDMAEFMRRVREDASSTRLTAGGSMAAGGGGGGGGGGLMSMLGGFGGSAAMLAAALPLLGGALAVGGTIGAGGAGLASIALGAIDNRSVGTRTSQLLGGGAVGNLVGDVAGGVVGRIQEYFGVETRYNTAAQGSRDPGTVRYEGEDFARMYGFARGALAGLGQGPTGMIAQTFGGEAGAVGGQRVGGDIAESLGAPREVGQVAGAEIGRRYVSGAVQRYLEEGMQRYPGFLSTVAGMQSVAQYGGNLATIRGAGTTAFGYGPESIGAEFGGLLTGLGGGLTGDAYTTSMAYARRFGVSLGSQGSAIGSLLMAGGGPGNFSDEQRSNTLRRVMTDAVAAGFGRRLGDFSRAIGGTINAVMGGPSFVQQAVLPQMIDELSSITSAISQQYNVGADDAQRMLAPLAGAPGAIARGLTGTGGDANRSMALLWQMNRARYGHDPAAFQDAIQESIAAGGVMGREMMGIYARPLGHLLETTSTEFGARASVRDFFGGLGLDVPIEMLQQIAGPGRHALIRGARGAGLSRDEMLEAMIGTVGAGSLDASRGIQRAGSRAMGQMGMLRAQAGYQEQQLAISSAMAPDASRMLAEQLGLAQTTAGIIRDEDMITEGVQIMRAGREALQREGVEGLVGAVAERTIEAAQRRAIPRSQTGTMLAPTEVTGSIPRDPAPNVQAGEIRMAPAGLQSVDLSGLRSVNDNLNQAPRNRGPR